MKIQSAVLKAPIVSGLCSLVVLSMLLLIAFPLFAQNAPSRSDAIRIASEIHKNMLNGEAGNVESNVASLRAYVESRYGAEAANTDEGEAIAEMESFITGTPIIIPADGTSTPTTTATTTIVDFLQNVNSLYQSFTDEEYPEDQVSIDRTRVELTYATRRMQLDVLEGSLSRAESNGAEEIYDIWSSIEPEMRDSEAKQTMATIVTELEDGFERGDSAGIFAIGARLENHIDPLMTQLESDEKKARTNKIIIGAILIIVVGVAAYAILRRKNNTANY